MEIKNPVASLDQVANRDHDLLTGLSDDDHPRYGITQGLVGNRPAAGTAGRLYYATDEDKLYRDNGSSWDYMLMPSNLTELFDTLSSYSGNANKVLAVNSAEDAIKAKSVQTPGFTLSAGESVNVGQPVTIGEGSTFTRFSETLGGDSWEAIGTSGIEKRRWQIYGSDIGDKFNQANLYVSVTGSPSDELQVKIWDAAYNNVLATGTITPATISGGSTPFAVTLDNVVASQDIYVELSRTGSLDGSNYFEVRVEQNDQYATDEEYWNGSSWASNSGWGWHLGLIYKKLTDYLYLSSATDTNDLDDTFGLTTESGSFGDNIFVINRGIVEKSGWGLTAKSDYYVADTAGTLATSAGTNTKKVGFSLTSEKLLVLM